MDRSGARWRGPLLALMLWGCQSAPGGQGAESGLTVEFEGLQYSEERDGAVVGEWEGRRGRVIRPETGEGIATVTDVSGVIIPPEGGPWQWSSGQGTISLEGGIGGPRITLSGQVRVAAPPLYEFRAETVEFQPEARRWTVPGGATLLGPDLVLRGTGLTVDLRGASLTVHRDVRAVLRGIRLGG